MIGLGQFLAGARVPSVRGIIGTSALAVIGAGLVIAGAASAQSDDPEIADINKHYEIATKDFGDGTVMMTSRHDTENGPVFTTHQFNCDDNSYSTVFEGDAAPSAFPDPVSAQQTNEFGEGDDVVPLAQHACTKYGRPLAEW